MVTTSATPLISLDALAIDTETTDLDARKAAVVEIAVVPLVGGRLDEQASRRTLVRPPARIPEDARRIHGISDADVADAPTFAQAWPGFATTVASSVLIGHSTGYDLAVLRHECARAGLSWQAPRALDVRLLSEIIAPNLSSYALESLASWLKVESGARHSAIGDAVTAGRIFLALVPLLRERGIRTLAEAERACAGLIAARDAQHRAGWTESGEPPAAPDTRTLIKLDSTPYRYRIRDVMTAPVLYVDTEAPLIETVKRMTDARASSLFVAFNGEASTARDTGIVTERDAMRCIAAAGEAALGMHAREIANRPLITVPQDALMFVAIARMSRLGIRHLGVTDSFGRIVGALSARDLLRLRAGGSVALGDEISVAEDVHALGRAWARLPAVAAGLLSEGLSGREIAEVVSHQLAALTERAAILAEKRMEEEGRGSAPCDYAFCVLGSAGRGESLLALDQDNALVFADGGDTEAHDRWFAELARHVTAILNEVGVPYCKGNVMASNPLWRGPLSLWRQRIAAWIRHSSPQDLLAVDIFFDMRGVHGNIGIAEALWRDAFDAARGQVAFAKLLASGIGDGRGFTLFGGFRTENGRLDLKQSGLFGVVTAARALAICHHVAEHATPARLAGVAARGIAASDLEALSAAQGVFMDRIVAQQLVDIERGVPPSNSVEIKRLSRNEREELRAALKSVANLEELVRDNLFQR